MFVFLFVTLAHEQLESGIKMASVYRIDSKKFLWLCVCLLHMVDNVVNHVVSYVVDTVVDHNFKVKLL